jgi:hypothetical protein
MPKHILSAVMCGLLATTVAATVNAAHEDLNAYPPRSAGADGILTQVNDALVGGDRWTFLELAEFVDGLRPTR